jgi:hypothetical protein
MATTPVKTSDVYRFLTAKGANWQCPSCGHQNHANLTDEVADSARLALLSFPFPGHDVMQTSMLDVVGIACGNCFHIRLYAHTPIADWAAQNPPH